MKYILLVFALWIIFAAQFKAHAQGDAPPFVQGQNQTAKTVASIIEVPANQSTKITSSKTLLELGNSNLLVNPSFEHITFNTGWTCTGATPVVDTVNVAHGKKSMSITGSATTFECYQDSTINAVSLAGVDMVAMIRAKASTTAGTLKLCSRAAGTTSTQNCTTNFDNTFNFRKMPFTGNATSNGISIAGTSWTGSLNLDDGLVGAVDLKQDVDASRIAGESYFAGTASCIWPRTGTTLGAFTATAACPGPTINLSTMGEWQTTDSDLPRQPINNLPAGKYKATFLIPWYSTATSTGSLAINDGTTTCTAVVVGASTNSQQGIVSCVFSYASSGNRVFELYSASAGSTFNIENNLATVRNVKFQLEYFSSSSTYSSTNADTDWAACSFSTLAWQGLGTVTSYLRCKRQGSDLLVAGRVVTGTVAAAEARIPLPAWNGSALVAKGSSVLSALQHVGKIAREEVTATNNDFTVLANASSTYLTIGVLNSTGEHPFGAQQGTQIFGNADVFSIDARIPIEGWENSNVIIGQFNGLESCADSYQCTDTFSAKVSAAGVVSDENIDWINGNCSVTNIADFACTFKTSLALTVPMNCVVSSSMYQTSVSATTLSQALYTTWDSGTTRNASSAQIICQKQGADYIGKTAKAVASDASLATAPGNAARVSTFRITGATDFTNCTASPCTVRDVIGETPAITRNGAGDYTFTYSSTFSPNSKIVCIGNGNQGTTRGAVMYPYTTQNPTGTVFRAQFLGTDASTVADVWGQVTCYGR